MSGGQQQRVAVFRALVGEPDLILADEPTGNLDSTWAAEIADLLLLANQGGATLLVATHDPWLASKARRSVHLVDGCITSS
jgi:putative ABC transport system ATP-binding protein